MPIQNYIIFFNRARKRFNSTEDYIKFQRFQASWILENLDKCINLKNKTILDLGSGNGGYTLELSNVCEMVYSLDLNRPWDRTSTGNITFLQGDAMNIPLKDDSIDFVFCSSLIEHVPNQENLICEIKRVLKKDHYCYLSFPPFYSPLGGHQFKPFHYLGEKNAVKLASMCGKIDANSFEDSWGNYGLFVTTIKSIKNKIKNNGLNIINISTRFCPINFAKLGLLGEYLTWHVEYLIRK